MAKKTSRTPLANGQLELDWKPGAGRPAGRLPEGWRWVTIGEIANTTSGGTPLRSHDEYYGGKIKWIKSGELRDKIIYTSEETITENGLRRSNSKIFPKGSVVVALYGATVGKTGILGVETATNQAVCGIFPLKNIFLPEFMFYWLQSERKNLINKSMGGAQPNISQGIIRSLVFPLPPLFEQERIVARIEELFTQLDAGVEALKRVQAGLKRYKAAVLKAAVEGNLTNPSPGTGPRAKGENGLPEGWRWVTVGDLVESMKNGIYKSSEFYNDIGVACLRMYNINDGRIIWKDIKRMILSDDEVRTYGLSKGDILINRVNSRELVGKAAVIREVCEPLVYESKNIRIKIRQNGANSNYINICFNVFGKKYFNFNAQQVVGMASINQNQISLMPIPLPSLEEQQIIALEAERRLSTLQEVEVKVEANLQRAARLRQSILKAAFEGRLT